MIIQSNRYALYEDVQALKALGFKLSKQRHPTSKAFIHSHEAMVLSVKSGR